MATLPIVRSERLPLQEGRQILTIKKVAWDQKLNKVDVTFTDGRGGSCREQLLLPTGPIEKATDRQRIGIEILSTIYMCATGDFGEGDFDPMDMEGLQLVATVTKDDGKDRDGNPRVYTHVRYFEQAPEMADDEDEEDDPFA